MGGARCVDALFFHYRWELLRFAFPWLVDIIDEVRPRYNIAPSQQVAVVPNNNPTAVEMFRWGLDSILGQGREDWLPP